MIKRLFFVALIVALFMSSVGFADRVVENESKYGLPLDFSTNNIDNLEIQGCYLYQDQEDYYLTVVYSGDLLTMENGDRETVKTSFFNPPDGNKVKISWLDEFDRVTSDETTIQYRVDKSQLEESEMITIFFYESEKQLEPDERISVFFHLESVDYNSVPMIDELIQGYEFDVNKVTLEGASKPSSWAEESIENLKAWGKMRASAFENLDKGITRSRFVYLMVELYENLVEKQVEINPEVSYVDTKDPYALKAASIGITTGVGNNRFAPDQVVTREEMATFLVKTLSLAGVELKNQDENITFDDHDTISPWAKDSIYLARNNRLINGVGKNVFAPKRLATNEQALVLTHSILSKFGKMELMKEVDGARFFLKMDKNLYRLNLEENIIVNQNHEKNDLFFMSYDDIDWFLTLAHATEDQLEYTESPNENVEGVLEPFSTNKLTIDSNNLYYGVDKIGEESILVMHSDFEDENYVAKWTLLNRSQERTFEGFEEVTYKGLNGELKRLHSLPMSDVARILGLDYDLSYNQAWDIYTIEFSKTREN